MRKIQKKRNAVEISVMKKRNAVESSVMKKRNVVGKNAKMKVKRSMKMDKNMWWYKISDLQIV